MICILKHMNPQWGERIPRGAPRKTARPDQVHFGRQQADPLLGHSSARGTSPKTNSDESAPGEAEVAHRYAKPLARDYDAVSQLEAMDEEGLDVAVLFRTFPLHCDDSLEAEYANDLCRAWNDWMADFCKADPKRLRPSALITLHDVDMAVDETRRAITELGAVGLCLVPEPSNGRHIHDRYFDPVWREAERLGAPICFHPAASPNQDQAVHRFKGHANEAVLINAFRNPVELMLAVGSFCAGGVLERFPNLAGGISRRQLQLAAVGAVSLGRALGNAQGLLQRADELAAERLFHDASAFISVDVEEDLVADVIRRIGDDNVVISTDYPHADSHWPNAVNHFMAIEMPSASRAKKFSGTTARACTA